MIEKVSPEENLGGFKILSDVLMGPQGGPQTMDEDPIVDPKDINLDDDNLGGSTDFDDPDRKPVGDDPIVDPTEETDPIVDPKDVEPTTDPEPTIPDPASEPTDDVFDAETQESIANYLKEELEGSLGWTIPEDYEIKSMEDVVDFMGDLVSKASKPTYANEEVRAYDEFVKNGGSFKDFYKT